MSGQRPEEEVDRPASHQRWEAMTMLHWAYPAEVVGAMLPEGLEADTWEDRAWVSITPFLMVDFRVGPLPPVPKLSTFPETNVRTYVRGPDGRDGLWFLSLEADSVPTVVGASTLYGVPYRFADMTVEQGDTTRYRSRRRDAPDIGHDIVVRVGGPCEAPSDFDHWLTGRWRAFTTVADRLATVPVQHQPWPLREAEVMKLEQTLLVANGLPEPVEDPLVHHSPGVDVRLGAPRPLPL
jgi:uncharacterized protein YqjF (DUF2071 family)